MKVLDFTLFLFRRGLVCIWKARISKYNNGSLKYFDSEWYTRQNPDVLEAHIDPAVHYYLYGYKEGRFPSPLFFPGYYQRQVGPRLQSEPLLHYLSHGWKQGFNPNPYFSSSWYIKNYPDVLGSKVNPYTEYLTNGWRKQREPNELFSSERYYYINPESRQIPALVHLLRVSVESGSIESESCFKVKRLQWLRCDTPDKKIAPEDIRRLLERYFFDDIAINSSGLKARDKKKFGKKLLRLNADWSDINPLFSPLWYRQQYHDLLAYPFSALFHYAYYGWKEKRNPHPLFFSGWYSKYILNIDVPIQDPLLHYLNEGWKDGLDPNPYFASKWYADEYLGGWPSNIIPIVHYLREGWKLGNEPNPNFNTVEYMDNNPEASIEPALIHYVRKIQQLEDLRNSIVTAEDPMRYDTWIRYVEKQYQDINPKHIQHIKESGPVISIVTPTFNTPTLLLGQLYDSLYSQYYDKWEWCIADGGSTAETLRELDRIATLDARVKVIKLGENRGIAGNTNAALSCCSGEWVGFVDHDDKLPSNALLEFVRVFVEDETLDIVYSDEDKISTDGRQRSNPHFKPDWSPDLLRSINYITHFLMIRASLVQELGGIREGFDGAQDYDLVLRATERARKIHHIPKVLYHWRMTESSTASAGTNKSYAAEAGRRALQDHVDRLGLGAHILTRTQDPGWWYEARYPVVGEPLVSIIVPNKDHTDVLDRCIESILSTSYKNWEMLVVENNSVNKATFEYYTKLVYRDERIKLLTWSGDFNYSAINNYAADHANGEYYLLLNNDVEAINPDFIEKMLGLCQRKDVGAVGALLLFPDDTVQHAGVILGLGGIAGHSHKYYPVSHPGYFRRLQMISNLSAVTGACLMVPAQLYHDLDGLDAERFPVAFNDVDFCLRIRKTGKLVVWTPEARGYHYESKSRGLENTPEKQARFKREVLAFERRWHDVLSAGDPYYNPNLVSDAENFAVRIG